MSGFAGLISRPGMPSASDGVARMIIRMRRRHGAAWSEIDYPDVHARLGGIGEGDQTPAPATSADGTVSLTFCGEEFTSFRAPGEPAAAVLAEQYRRHGSEFFARLNGQFCGVLVDRRAGTLTVFNDRFGLGRIYYHEAPDGFRFATEAKALLAVVPSAREFDPRGLAEHLVLGCVLQNRTLFRGVQLLPPGSAWTFHRDGTVAKRRYFDPAAWEQQEELDPIEYREQLREVFARATRRTLRNASRLGMSLTGGLDSRAVIAWTNSDPGTLPCYTFGGPYRDCADVRIARQLASVCQHPHTTIRVDADFYAAFDELAARSIEVSDGAMDITGAVELHVNRFARDIAPIRLTGNYGSEILRSHLALRPARIDTTHFQPEFAALIEQAHQTYREELLCHPLTFIAFKQVPWHHYARLSVERAEISPRSPFLDNELVALAFRAPAELRHSAQPMLDLIAAGNPVLAGIHTDRALRAGAARWSTRVAARWQDFTVKAEYAYDYGMPRWLAQADRMLNPLHLERLFLGHHKFYHFRIWYREPLSRYVRAHAIEAPAQPACFRPGAVRQLATEHLSGRANHTLALHKALTLRLIEQQLLRAA